MSNMMPGDNSGAEPAEHSRNCTTECKHTDHVFDHDKAFHILLTAAAEMSYWTPGDDTRAGLMQRMCNEAYDLVECPAGHRSHDCNCNEPDDEVY